MHDFLIFYTNCCYLCGLVCFVFVVLDAMCIGFLIGFADRPPSVAIHVCVFLFFLRFLCYVHGLFDWFRRRAAIGCCVCVSFLCFCV